MVGRRGVVLGGVAAMLARPARALERRYTFGQDMAVLSFTAHHLGLFTSTGRFGAFSATIDLDPADPTRASVEVVVQTASVMLDWPGAVDLLRSPAFFDVERHPVARFRGQAVGAGEAGDFPLRGSLTVRGITDPFSMRARLESRAFDPAYGAEVARFSARGTLSRSAYGMTEDALMIGDAVEIGVAVRLVLGPAHG